MFYVDSGITFRFFSGLLWKSTLLISYKLDILRPSQVNQFDMYALLFGSYSSFLLLNKFSLVAKTILFSWLLIIGEIFDWDVMLRQFVSLNIFLDR